MDSVLKDRDYWVGGSDIPAIMERSSFSSRFELIESKLKPNEEREDQPFMQKYIDFGNYMEPIIRKHINETLDTSYEPTSIENGDLRIRGNVDGFDKNAPIQLLEIKTYGAEPRMEEYKLQVQLYMYLFDVEQCLLVGYRREVETEDFSFNDFKMEFNEDNLTQVIINRDDELLEEILDEVDKFIEELDYCKHKLVEEGEIPTQMDLLMTSESSPLVDVLNEYESVTNALNEMKRLKDQEKELRKNLLELMQEYNIKKIDNESVTISVKDGYVRTGLDSKRFKEEQPELFEQYKKETQVAESITIKLK